MKAVFCLTLFGMAIITLSAQAAGEPAWLFTVPKADSLKEGTYNIGFIYFDFGITDNLEIGIHGVKYSLGNLAFGLGLYPLGSPYLVFTPDTRSTSIHIGIKAAPYVFFGGLEAPVSDKARLIVEINNGLSAGFRILPTRNWSLDLFLAFISFEVYKYKYQRFEVEEFHAIPAMQLAYSGRF